ncbi:MAG: hypothetical protein A2X86_08690 [Bdellovibrionales bacterium GWA2_49_15]|nr:MAG: hypothetical protein A2X86_08690 [Bdellovibrionales bacterium GWA2_49_15]HAZ11159.1 hypothetical protein [Bdellovibrionales bacterium]
MKAKFASFKETLAISIVIMYSLALIVYAYAAYSLSENENISFSSAIPKVLPERFDLFHWGFLVGWFVMVPLCTAGYVFVDEFLGRLLNRNAK